MSKAFTYWRVESLTSQPRYVTRTWRRHRPALTSSSMSRCSASMRRTFRRQMLLRVISPTLLCLVDMPASHRRHRCYEIWHIQLWAVDFTGSERLVSWCAFWISEAMVDYLSALDVCSRRGAIRIHVYLTLPYLTELCSLLGHNWCHASLLSKCCAVMLPSSTAAVHAKFL